MLHRGRFPLTALGRIIYGCAYVEALEGHLLAHLLEAEPARLMVVTQNVSGSKVTNWIRI